MKAKKILQKRTEVEEKSSELTKARKSIRRQIIISVAALLLIIVLAFSMTMAWYTNIAQTKGLSFKTEPFGIDSDVISIGEEHAVYKASPGASGIIPMSVDNTAGDTPIIAQVNVSKNEMSVDMQQRMFFYADKSATYTFGEEPNKTTETVNKIWIGSEETESYRYNISSADKLVISESYYSDTPIKWMWVYDLLGYYFNGEISGGVVKVNEYIRPVEYSLDDAVFSLDDEEDEDYGRLISVSNKTLAQLMKEMFDNDGFEGTLELDDNNEIKAEDYVNVSGKIFYKVNVDENGKGIWVYLCNYSEIQRGIQYDNALTGDETITATVKVTILNTESHTTSVSSTSELINAITEGTNETIVLTSDMTLSEVTDINEEADVTIDLDGHNLKYTGTESTYSAFTVPEGASLTISDGTITGNGLGSGKTNSIKSVAFMSNGGTVNLTNVTVRGYDSALDIKDNLIDADSTIKIIGCDFDTNASSILVYGNGSSSDGNTRLIIQDCKINSNYVGIIGNGTSNPGDSRWGTEVVIINSEITGYWAAIYQPQQYSSLTISGCTLEGYTGVVIKGGSATITNSRITGTGARNEPAVNNSGFTDTGDGVYVEAVYDWPASVNILGSGNNIVSNNAYAVELFGKEGSGTGKITIEGGTLNGTLGATRTNNIGTLTVDEQR